MKQVLLINPFDSLPGEKQREHRYTIIYKKLKKLTDVTWISSNYQHYSHQQRDGASLSPEDRGKIILLPMLSYKKNIGLRRVLSYFLLSVRTLFEVIRFKKKPDLILCWGPVEQVYLITLYAKYKKIKIIIDVIDTWPDLYVLAFPKWLRFLGKHLLLPYFYMSKRSLSLATHITSVSKTYTEWAMSRGNRIDKQNSSYYYLGCNTNILHYNHDKSRTRLKCLFAGQFSFNYDVETIVAVAKRLYANKVTNIEFVLAGDGYKRETLLIASAGLDNIRFTGWISSAELIDIASDCHIGLNCYTREATQSVPFKVFDYMSMGLYVINSLKGEMNEFLTTHQIGDHYEANNVESLYNKLIQMSFNVDSVINCGYKSFCLFQDKFKSDNIYDNMIADIILKNL